MSTNDTAKLYQFFGGQASEYQELRRSDDAKSGKERWPLLAWLDLSTLHVPDAPRVQSGEVQSKPATAPVMPAAVPPVATVATPITPAVPMAVLAAMPVAPATMPAAPPPVVPVAIQAPVWLPGVASQAATLTAAQPMTSMAPSAGSALQQVFARIAQAQAPAQPHLASQPQPDPMPTAAPRSPLWSQLSKL